MSGIEEGVELRYGRFRGGTKGELPLGTPQISSPLRTPLFLVPYRAFATFQIYSDMAVALCGVLAQRIQKAWPETNDAIVLKLGDVAQEQIDGMAVEVSEAEH